MGSCWCIATYTAAMGASCSKSATLQSASCISPTLTVELSVLSRWRSASLNPGDPRRIDGVDPRTHEPTLCRRCAEVYFHGLNSPGDGRLDKDKPVAISVAEAFRAAEWDAHDALLKYVPQFKGLVRQLLRKHGRPPCFQANCLQSRGISCARGVTVCGPWHGNFTLKQYRRCGCKSPRARTRIRGFGVYGGLQPLVYSFIVSETFTTMITHICTPYVAIFAIMATSTTYSRYMFYILEYHM